MQSLYNGRMELTKRQHSEPTRTMVMLGPTEKAIIAQFARDMGIGSHSAALRQIVREWNQLKAAEKTGALRSTQAA